MSRLIDADKCYNDLNELSRGKYGVEAGTIDDCMNIIDSQPTGNAVELPCNVGDTVYYPFAGKVFEKQIVCFVHYRNGSTIAFFDERMTESCEITDFGKTVYLTREEAEAALAKMDK